jgi:hypothetical protein
MSRDLIRISTLRVGHSRGSASGGLGNTTMFSRKILRFFTKFSSNLPVGDRLRIIALRITTFWDVTRCNLVVVDRGEKNTSSTLRRIHTSSAPLA